MKRELPVAILIMVTTVGLPWLARADEPLTRSCNTNYQASDLMVGFANGDAANAALGVVANPALDPDLYRRLASPKSGYRFSLLNDGVFYYNFDLLVDTAEVAAAMLSDPVLAAHGITAVTPDHYSCDFGVLPAPGRVTITEYHNRILDHYFLSSSTVENQAIDSGAAGPGWERTGEAFIAGSPDPCSQTSRVFRFYAAGPNSHFFTVGPGECGVIHNTDPGWQLEGDAFGAILPVGGACIQGWIPLYRVYNNGYATNNSNHRYVVRADLYAQMQAQGWIGEGVTMCLPVR